MPLPVKNYYHAQATVAPQLSGQAGALISVLDACLVTGFNSKSVASITVAANVATVTTTTNHNLAEGDNIVISGAAEAAFNNEFSVKASTSSTTFTMDCVTGLTAATGTITLKIAPLGWEKVFAGTNLAVYRSTDPAATRLYLRVNDTTTTHATVAMYETMSDVNSGTGKSADLYWTKSDAASAATRPWTLFGDSKRFYFLPCYTNSALALGVAFGDSISYKPGDAYHCMLIGQVATLNPWNGCAFPYVGSNAVSSGQLLARAYTQIGGAVSFYKVAPMILSTAAMGYGTGLPAINPGDNGIHLVPVLLVEVGSANIRGPLPGLLAPMESVGANFATRDKTLTFGGKTYMAAQVMCGSTTFAGVGFFDITGPWG